MEKKIGNVIIDYKNYHGVDLYSDGEIEDELLDLVKKYDQSQYNSIIFEKKKWPILYHLSHIRGNIIDFLPIDKTHKILEIGSGCGAITGKLAEKAKHVTCVELSEKRSLINAYRNKNMDNIKILLGNFEDVEKNITEKYDYITLIGVFEYAESYISSIKPYEDFLNTIKNHLKEDGKIILAIENRFGLKYWAGCQEDHVGRYFEGLENYPKTTGVRTFTKKELEEIFIKSGFIDYKFYYPYPDYKLSTTIYSDEYLPKKGELKNNIRNFDRERLITFDETRVFDTIISENMFQIYANSFLIILNKGRL